MRPPRGERGGGAQNLRLRGERSGGARRGRQRDVHTARSEGSPRRDRLGPRAASPGLTRSELCFSRLTASSKKTLRRGGSGQGRYALGRMPVPQVTGLPSGETRGPVAECDR